jgi:flavin reductase (DIM6/NTAB) family NADH-FMN oxidoreductase RutF
VTGVAAIVTLADLEPLATTAGSLVVASWQPPLLAVLFGERSRMAAAIDQCGRFTVNVLGEADHGLALRFARPDREQGWDALSRVGLLRRDPAPPRLASAIAWADCVVVQVIPMGDHRCYVGEVRDGARQDDTAPLAYYRGRFRALGPAVAPAAWLTIDEADMASAW